MMLKAASSLQSAVIFGFAADYLSLSELHVFTCVYIMLRYSYIVTVLSLHCFDNQSRIQSFDVNFTCLWLQ